MNQLYNVNKRLLEKIQRIGFYLALFILFIPAVASTTHIVGGSISYKCIGNDQYEVTLTVRRDCILGAADAPFDDPASVGIFDQNGNLLTGIGENGELRLPFNNDETLNNEINQICYSNQSSICVHITQYVGVINLPARDGGYTLSYQRCCRNASLTNVIDPLNTGMTLFIDVTADAIGFCNTSPRFNFRPDIFICAGEELSFNASAVDEEGDLLVYSFCAPYRGATKEDPKPQPPGAPPYVPVSWSSGFDASNTLGNNDFTIDASTGIVTGNPGFTGQYLVGMCVEEYRDGVLLSTTHREFQYNVVNCDDRQVIADFEVSQNECGLENLTFTNKSTPGSSYTWFFDYPSEDPNFTSSEESPIFSYPMPGRYSIRLVAQNQDTGCESIVDKDITISDGSEEGFSTSILSCTSSNELNIRLSDETGLDALERVWEIIINGRLISGTSKSIEFTAARDAQITATLTVNGQTGCLISQSEEVNVNIDELAAFDYEIVSCASQIVTLRLTDQPSVESDLVVSTADWRIIRENGEVLTGTGSELTIDLFENEKITITQALTFTNACTAESTQIIDLDLNDLASFDTQLESCMPGERNRATVSFSAIDGGIPINGTIISQEWMVINGETEFNSTDDVITLDLDFTSPVWVGHTVQFSNGCTANEERKITLNEVFDTDVSINSSIENCDGDEVTVRFFNEAGRIETNWAVILHKAWTITTADGTILRNTGPFIEYTGRKGEIIEVYYLFNSNDGCAFEQRKTIELGVDDQAINFTDQIIDCEDDQISVKLTDNRSSDRTDWTIYTNGVPTNRSGKEIIIRVNRDDVVKVTLQTDSTGGCGGTTGREIISNPDDLLNYRIDQVDCPLGGIELQFVDTSPSIGGATKESINWVFQRSNGQTSSATGQSTLQLFDADDVISIMMDVQYSNGCRATLVETLDLNFANYLDYDVELISCNGPNQFSLELQADTDALPPSDPVSGIFWFISNGTKLTNESGSTVALDVNMDQSVELKLAVSYGNRCMFTLTRFLSIDEILGDGINNDNDVTISQSAVSCQGDDVTFRLSNNSEIVLGNSARIINKTWTVRGVGIDLSEQGNQIELTAPNGTSLDVMLRLELDNDCVFILRESRTVSPLDEESINFTEDISSCDGDNVNVTLTDNNDTGTSIWLITINGQTSTRTGRVISLTVNRNDEIQARLDTGSVAGCEGVEGRDIIVNPDDAITYHLNQIACTAGEIQLEFIDNSPSLGGAVKESINWVFQTSDGQTFSASGATTMQSFPEHDLITVMLDVQYANGCRGILNESLDLNFGNALDYDARLISCNGPNQFTVELTADADALPINQPITGYTWEVTNGSNVTSQTGSVIQLDVNMDLAVIVELVISYDNDCEYSLIKELSFDDLFGDGIEREDDVQINIDPQVCGSDEISYSINNRTTFLLDNTARVISKEWKITAPGVDNNDDEELSDQRNICEAENTISILGQTLEAVTNTLVCVPFNAYNFIGVGSIQTAFAWDPTVLSFDSFKEGALSGIDLNTGFVESGELRMVWLVDFRRTEVTLDDNTTLFEICFDAVGSSGSATDVSFTGIQNLAIEITNEDLQVVDACLQAAEIELIGSIEPPTSTTMTMFTGSGDEILYTGNIGDEVNVMLTMELDNGCILILNETFTVENVDIDFFNDFPDITMPGDNTGNQGGNTGDDSQGGHDGGGMTDDNSGQGMTGSQGDEDAIIVICAGEPRPLLSNPNPNWTYEWSPNTGLIFQGDDRSNPLAFPSQTTTYSVTVTAGECSSTGTITVIPVDQFTFTITNGGTDACGGNVNLSVAAAPGARVQWSLTPDFTMVLSSGSTLSTTQTDASRSYYVRQIFSGGCVSPIQSFTIETLDLDITGVSIDPITNESILPVCGSNLVTISATTNGNPTDIQWIDRATNAVIGSGPSIELDASQVMTIRAALDGGNGCVANTEDTTLVPYDAEEDISLSDSMIPEVFCVGLDTPISLHLNGDSELQFSWSPDPCIVSGSTTASPVINATENKDLIVTVTHVSTGCVDQLVIPIRISTDDMTFEITDPLGNLNSTDICGDAVTLMASMIAGAEVEWSLDESFTDILAEGNQLSTVQEGISQTYYARQRLAGGCFSAVESFVVNSNDIVIEGVNTETNTLAFCGEQLTMIRATTNAGAENIMWFDAATDELLGTGSPLEVDPAVVTMFYGTVEGPSGCESRTETITLVPFNIEDLLDLNLGEQDGIPNGVCSGESTQLNVTNRTELDLLYEWGPSELIESGGNTASPIISITEDTEFTIRVTNPESNCVIEVPIPIMISDPTLELFADPSSQIYLGSDVDILAETDAENPTYIWSTGETTSTINVEPTENMSYTVTVTDENGCSVVKTIDITVMTDCSASGIFLPNAFTPNSDGSNDELFVRTNSLRDVSLVIYDRWGREVFQTNNKDIGWNGRWQNEGDELPPDAYGYILTAVCFTGDEYTQQGNVSILR